MFSGVYGFCGTAFSSAPYAVREGGWLSLFFLPLISGAAFATSILLGACLRQIQFDYTRFEGDFKDVAVVATAPYAWLGRLLIVTLSVLVSYVSICTLHPFILIIYLA